MSQPGPEGYRTTTPRMHLPMALTSFIGRGREVAEITGLVAAARLVTLTGVGGCGKTRLALRVASDLGAPIADGVFWVELGRISDPALVPLAVARVVNVAEQPGRSVVDVLLDYLHDRNLLLVLDNCEHLASACALLVESLLGAPHLRILATSREPLGVTGERRYPVAPLAFPAPDVPSTEVAHFEAVQLFAERARAILPTFALTPDRGEVIARICRHLDGLPLGIELASARVNVLTLEEMEVRLADRFDWLTSTSQGVQASHQTLRAAIDWSYDLMSAHEQGLLRQLSVFAAGCSLEAAEAVWSGDREAGARLLDVLSELVNKSLVVAETLEGRAARYRLLETIRHYARAKLIGSEEWSTTYDRYLKHYLRVTEEIAPKLGGPYHLLWMNWLEEEHDNIREALAWALDSQRIETGLRIVTALDQFWTARSHLQEGRLWFDRLLAQATDQVSLVVHSQALTHAAFLTGFLRDAPASLEYGRRAVALCEAAGEGGKPALAFALAGLVMGEWVSGDFQASYQVNERVIRLHRELDEPFSLGMALLTQGITAMALAEYETAGALLGESLALARAAPDPFRTAMSLNYLGDLARCQRDYVAAQIAYAESISLYRELGAARDLAGTLHNLAHACLHADEVERAEALFRESLSLQRELGNAPGVGECLLGFAALAVRNGRPGAAATLLAAARSITGPDTVAIWPAERMEFDHYSALVRAELSDAEFQAEQAKGHSFSLEQAIKYALGLPLQPPGPQRARAALGGLSEREREVVVLVARGKSNAEIAAELVVSKRTVEKHIGNVLSKLDLASRAGIVRWAMEHNLA